MSYQHHTTSSVARSLDHHHSGGGVPCAARPVPTRLGSISAATVLPRRVASLTDAYGDGAHPRGSLPPHKQQHPTLNVVDYTQSQRHMHSVPGSRSWNLSDCTQTQRSVSRLSAPPALAATPITHPDPHHYSARTQGATEDDKLLQTICGRLNAIQSTIMEDAYDDVSRTDPKHLAGLLSACQQLRGVTEQCVALRQQNLVLMQAIVVSVERRSSVARRRKVHAARKDHSEPVKRHSPSAGMGCTDCVATVSAPMPSTNPLAKRLMASLPGCRAPPQGSCTYQAVAGCTPKRNLLLLAREGGNLSDDNLFDI